MLFRKLCKMTYYCIFKIDRLYDWKKSPDTDVAVTLKKQKKNTKDEFEERAKAIIVEFAKQVGWHIEGSLVNKSDSKGGGWCGFCVCVFAWGFGFFFLSFHKTTWNIKKTVASFLTCWGLCLKPNFVVVKLIS